MLWPWLNTGGLVLGMIGVVLIFFWPPPMPSFETKEVLTADGEINADAVARNKRHKWLSALGLIFIFVGFFMQLLATWPGRG